MKKNKIITLLLALTLVGSHFETIKAAEIPPITNEQLPSEDFFDVRLDTIVVHTDYNEDDVYMERELLSDGATQVVVKDQTTGNILEKITEKEIPMVQARSNDYSTKQVTREQYLGPMTFTFIMHLKVYSSGSFRQIEEVLLSDYYITSSCSFYMNNVNTSVVSTTNQFPTVSLSYLGTATVVGEMTFSNSTGQSVGGSASFKLSEITSLGYSASVSSTTSNTTTYYFRKTQNIQGVYSVY